MPTDQNAELSFLFGGGEVGVLLRERDWTGHPLGAPATWPQSLRTMVGACINAQILSAVMWGPDLRLLYNDDYAPRLGERHPAALGEPVADVWGPAWDAVADDFHAVLRTGVGMAQRRVFLLIERHGHVEPTYWDFSATPIRGEDGRVVGLFNQGAEVTLQVLAEQRRDEAEAALRERTEQLSSTAEQSTRDRNALWELSSDLMLRCSFDGRIVAVNPAWSEVLGWSDADLLGHSIFDFIHPDDLDHTADGAQASADGEKFSQFTNRYRCRDGSYRWISWSTRPALGLINAVGRDVTDQRAQAEALAASQEQLRQSQKLEALGQLTGGIAHDFNNLLTVVSTSIQLLQRPGLAEDRRQRFMTAISNAVSRAARLTGQLLAFARRQTLQPVVFEVGHNLAAIGDMVRTLVGARVELRTELQDAGCIVDADPGQFDTAIVNLCVNARDAMQSEGVLTIRIRRVAGIPAWRNSAAVAGSYVAVEVTDTGCGIAPELLDRVFEPFFTTKKAGQGTGLGLSQVFGFVRQSGGDVQIASPPGRGTTFTLYLPVARRALAADDPLQAQRLSAAGQGLLLLVEDNPEVARSAEEALQALGYDTLVAPDAEQALRLLGENAERFAGVFSDVVMPGMNGVDLACEIARRHPGLPVLLSSGYSSELAGAAPTGFSLLAKPYSLEGLAFALNETLTTPVG